MPNKYNYARVFDHNDSSDDSVCKPDSTCICIGIRFWNSCVLKMFIISLHLMSPSDCTKCKPKHNGEYDCCEII